MSRSLYNELRGLAGSSVIFPIAERLERRDMRARQRELAVEMSLPFAERRVRSWNRLVQTVRFAGAKVPYYRDLFARARFDPELLTRDAKYLAEIPVLTKDIIRAEGERLLRDDHADDQKYVSKTGGSTGPSANVTYDQDGADWSSSVTRYARGLVGAGPRQLQLHMATRFQETFPIKARLREQIKCLANNRLNFAFSSFAPKELDGLWRRIKAVRPYLVHGHPSTLYQLALHVAGEGREHRAFDVFESSGEQLDARQRDAIERVFGCRVINRYGLAEAGVVAYQTDPQQTAMLVFDPVAWPEIIDVEFGTDLPEVPGGRCGELVVTALRNGMMPLIRYRTGDIAAFREAEDGFFVQDMIGRIHDVVQINGVRTPTHVIQDRLDRAGGIREFQIENQGIRPLFRLVPEPGVAAATIEQKLRSLWSDAIDVEIVEAGALKLQGWQAKFRHLVTPRAPGSLEAP